MTRGDRVELSGVDDVWKTIKRLERKSGPRIAGKVLGAANRSFAAGIKRHIPKINTPGHSNKRLKKSVGYRYKKSQKLITSSKVGFRVGGMEKAFAAPHAHLYVLGTRPRKRRRIGGKFKRFDRTGARSTGSAPAHLDIVPTGVASSINKARRNMKRTAKRELQKERNKRRKRK